MSRVMQNCETRLNSCPSGEQGVPREYSFNIPLRHIHIEGETIPDYIERRGFSLKEVVLLPVDIVPNSVKDALFYIQFGEERVAIKPTHIEHFHTFSYWMGVYGDRNPLDILRKLGHWSINELKPGCQSFVNCSLIRESPYHYKNESLHYFPMGWHQVLPIDILQEAKKNHWRIEVGPFSKCPKESVPDLYCSNGYMCHLTQIPVNLYSVGEEESQLEKTVHVDIRDFRNMYLFFRHQIELFKSEGRACRSLLDLFDAMLATKAQWYVDSRNELIYLPCIEKPPERFYRLLKLKLHKNGALNLENLINSHRFVDRVKDLFPCQMDNSEDLLAKEAIKRMTSAGIWTQCFENALVVERNWVFCVIPSVLSY
jgi:hypothetical protein